MTKSVITISRQYGSGGRFVARKLAERLGIPFYDNELITMAAKESGYSENMFENAEKISTHSLLYSLSIYGAAGGVYGLPLSDKVFLVQSDIIKKCADSGPCVIVGRCSDYVLKDYDNVLSFFLHSDIDSRAQRVEKFYDVKAKNLKDEIYKRDKKRATYYNYYTTHRWGDIENYNLSINVDSLGIDGCVDLLEAYVNKHDAK